MSFRIWVGLTLTLAGAACRPAAELGAPLRMLSEATGGVTTLTLVSAPGVRINARVKPALELPNGTVLRFDSPHHTPDSSYFTRPPTATLPTSAGRIAGTLRASVCAADELVCRTVTLRL